MAQRSFILVLAHEHLQFRIPELESIFSLNKLCAKSIEVLHKNSPFVIVNNVQETDIQAVLSRTVLIKHGYELWGLGNNYDELKTSIKNFPNEYKNKFFEPQRSFCIRVKGFGRKVSTSEQVKKIDSLENVLPLEGQVELSNPTDEYHILEDFGYNNLGHAGKIPEKIYFGRLVGNGQRQLNNQYAVKKRKFIGNTSMDALLSFVMSNLACVKHGDFVCDPFVGTGSLLVSAAHCGAWVCGGDINYNIIHGRGKTSRAGGGWREKDESIKYSLAQYGLSGYYVDVLVHDAAADPWKHQEIFDAIIADPPYGVREQCKKVGTKKPMSTQNEKESQQIHFPEHTSYNLGDVFKDLLNFSYRTLVLGGRLVYWIPVYRPEYTESLVPWHPGLRIIYNCEQQLNFKTSRRLIVMEKHKLDVMSSAQINANVYDEHNSFRKKYFMTENVK